MFMQLQEAVSKSDGLSSIVTIRQDEMRHLQEQARLPVCPPCGARAAAAQPAITPATRVRPSALRPPAARASRACPPRAPPFVLARGPA